MQQHLKQPVERIQQRATLVCLSCGAALCKLLSMPLGLPLSKLHLRVSILYSLFCGNGILFMSLCFLLPFLVKRFEGTQVLLLPTLIHFSMEEWQPGSTDFVNQFQFTLKVITFCHWERGLNAKNPHYIILDQMPVDIDNIFPLELSKF